MTTNEPTIKQKIIDIVAELPEGRVEAYGARNLKLIAGKKTFANYMNSHHDDGIIAVWCKAAEGDQDFLVQIGPERFFVPPYLGPGGWIALRLDTGTVDWDEVAELLTKAYRLVALKRHLKLLDG